MKACTHYFTVLFLITLALPAVGQSLIFQEDFSDSLTVVNSWSNGGMEQWEWRSDGEAPNGSFWNNRGRIDSPSQGGAIVMDSDALGAGSHVFQLVSPELDLTALTEVYIEFYQYFRNFQSTTLLEFSYDLNNWEILAELNIDAKENIETARRDRQLVDATGALAGQTAFIRFTFSGNRYFWILDDFNIYDGPPILGTFPSYLGPNLEALGKPYLTDSLGGAFNPEQLIVKFVPGTPEADKEDIREEFAVYDVQYCDCDSLELWFIDGASDAPTGLGPTGGTIGVLANKDQAKSKSEVDDVDLNHFNFSEIQILGDSCGTFAGNFIDGVALVPDQDVTATVIAILDTGVDYGHSKLLDHIWRSGEPNYFNGMDEDDNCYPDDFIGWNFVCDNNNPWDDHSHGTHVAGIVVDSISGNDNSCNFRIMPVKTHDRNGIAELFDVICGTYYAYKNGAQVINDSWGWYGIESTILRGAIEDARDAGTIIVAAAGNDNNDISSDRQYPATHPVSNIITVGAIDSASIQRADFSNFSPAEVDIAAVGVGVLSTVPDDDFDYKSGTSMATPMVSAAAAIVYCSGKTDPSSVKYNVLYCAKEEQSLDMSFTKGRVLQYLFPCLVPTEDLPELVSYELSLFPNPTEDLIWVQVEESIMEPATIEVLNSLGQTLWQKQTDQLLADQPLAIDLSHFQSGMYFIRVQVGAQMWIGQGVKVE
jgi:hypothetical protein